MYQLDQLFSSGIQIIGIQAQKKKYSRVTDIIMHLNPIVFQHSHSTEFLVVSYEIVMRQLQFNSAVFVFVMKCAVIRQA